MAGNPNAGERSATVQQALSVVDLGRQATTAYSRRDLSERLALTRRRLSDPAFHVHLLDRFGLFGVRLAVALIRQGVANTATVLSTELVRRSRLVELRDVLLSQFAQRRDVLKARSALLALESVLHEHPTVDREALSSELERITSAAHEFAEIRLLNALRAGGIKIKPAEAGEMERLLGADGGAMHTRLGLMAEADVSELRRALGNAIGRGSAAPRARCPRARWPTPPASSGPARACSSRPAERQTTRLGLPGGGNATRCPA